MEIIKPIDEINDWSLNKKCSKKSIAFVPTMGSLHQGHLSLILQAKELADLTVVSIFLNPLQFNDKSDYISYPRSDQNDIKLLQDLNIDVLFMPDTSEVYPSGLPDIVIDYPDLTNKLCGKVREGHFNGVLTIVHNLLMWVKPDFAIFGQKDYQQWLLVRNMAMDLGMNLEIIRSSIVRQKDGLAMSSRNARLSPNGKKQALNISKALKLVEHKWLENKETHCSDLENILNENLKEIKIEYAGLYDMDTLLPLEHSTKVNSALVAIACSLENVRCIDNTLLI